MSAKNIILSFMVFITIISSISTKIEDGKKSPLFNPMSFLNEEKKMMSFSDDSKFINVKCLYSYKYNMYSLQVLQNKDKDYEVSGSGKKVLFNFCQNTNKLGNSTFVQVDGDKVIRLAGSIDGEGDKKNIWTQTGNKDNPVGLQIELVPGDKCGNGNHQTTIDILCDEKVEKYDSFVFTSENSCTHKLTFNSLYGCSLRSSYLYLKLLQEYKIIFCIIFVLIGLAVCFYGQRYLKLAIIIISGLVGCYVLSLALLNFFPSLVKSEMTLLICLGVFFILGCVLGFFLNKNIKFCVVVLGGFLGYLSATFVYQIAQNHVDYDANTLRIICIIGCILVFAALGYCFADVIIILSTSIGGGYLAMRGVSLVAEHYLDEGYIIDLIKNKEWDQLKEIRDGWTYAYLGMWAVLAVAGIFIQCKNKSKAESL